MHKLVVYDDDNEEVFVFDDSWSLDEMVLAADRLRKKMVELDDDMSSIRTQIGSARVKRLTTGVYSSPDWWHRANTALRHKGRERQLCQNNLGLVNRKIKEARHEQTEREHRKTFVACAKEILSEDLYAAIWREVHRRSGPK
jgi:hypothetical protein